MANERIITGNRRPTPTETMRVELLAEGIECVINCDDFDANKHRKRAQGVPVAAPVAVAEEVEPSLLDGNVATVTGRVEALNDNGTLDALEAEERGGANRVTVLRAIVRRREEIGGDRAD
jgi:hypothetical protein